MQRYLKRDLPDGFPSSAEDLIRHGRTFVADLEERRIQKLRTQAQHSRKGKGRGQ